jgi:membrane-associated phospholipid phosphatase
MLSFYIFVSDLADAKVLLGLIILICSYLYFNKRNIEATVIAISALLAVIFTTLIKHLLQIPRPSEALVLESTYRFPSGHASMAGVACALTMYFAYKHVSDKKMRYVLYALGISWLLLISYARLYLQVHYLVDVIVGALIGIASVVVVIKNIKYIFK